MEGSRRTATRIGHLTSSTKNKQKKKKNQKKKKKKKIQPYDRKFVVQKYINLL